MRHSHGCRTLKPFQGTFPARTALIPIRQKPQEGGTAQGNGWKHPSYRTHGASHSGTRKTACDGMAERAGLASSATGSKCVPPAMGGGWNGRPGVRPSMAGILPFRLGSGHWGFWLLGNFPKKGIWARPGSRRLTQWEGKRSSVLRTLEHVFPLQHAGVRSE